MSGKERFVSHWKDSSLRTSGPGVQIFDLVGSNEPLKNSIRASLVIIGQGSTFAPKKFSGEAFYYFLSGNGILVWHHDDTDLSYLIDNDTYAWLPGAHRHSFENTGEGPMRCFVVTCQTNDSYKMRDGSVKKLDLLKPTGRKLADSFYGFEIQGTRRLLGGGYQLFSPGKAQNDHSHDEEIIYLVRGEGKLVIGSTEFELTAGSAALTPKNIKHRLINTGHDMFGYIVLEFGQECKR